MLDNCHTKTINQFSLLVGYNPVFQKTNKCSDWSRVDYYRIRMRSLYFEWPNNNIDSAAIEAVQQAMGSSPFLPRLRHIILEGPFIFELGIFNYSPVLATILKNTIVSITFFSTTLLPLALNLSCYS